MMKKEGKRESSETTKEMSLLLNMEIFDTRFSRLFGDDQSSVDILDCSSTRQTLRLGNVAMVDWCLSWIVRACHHLIGHVFLLTRHGDKAIEETIRKWQEMIPIHLIKLTGQCANLGDLLREVDEKKLVNDDFILVTSPAVIYTGQLKDNLEVFRKRRMADKSNNIMSLLYYEDVSSSDEGMMRDTLGLERVSNRLVLFHGKGDLILSKDFSLSSSSIELRRDIHFSGIALCSINVCSLFKDNFDFTNMDHLLREVLANEEVLCYNVHIDVLPTQAVCLHVDGYQSLLDAQSAILQRWTWPFTPDKINSHNMTWNRGNVYLPSTRKSDRNLMGQAKIGPNVLLGIDCSFGRDVRITNSSIGHQTILGDNCQIDHCSIGSNVIVGNDCRLQYCILLDGVRIGDNCQLPPRCILTMNSTVPTGLQQFSIDDIHSSTVEWSIYDGTWTKIKDVAEEENNSDSGSEIDGPLPEHAEIGPAVIDEGWQRFLEETCETLKRSPHRPEAVGNLKLEINGSKLAYTVPMEEVGRLLMKAFLLLPHSSNLAQLKSLTEVWNELFLNYYKPIECQMQALVAIEEHVTMKSSFESSVPHFVKLLYDLDVLEEEAIVRWFGELNPDSKMRPLVERFVDWLQNAESESD